MFAYIYLMIEGAVKTFTDEKNITNIMTTQDGNFYFKKNC